MLSPEGSPFECGLAFFSTQSEVSIQSRMLGLNNGIVVHVKISHSLRDVIDLVRPIVESGFSHPSRLAPFPAERVKLLALGG